MLCAAWPMVANGRSMAKSRKGHRGRYASPRAPRLGVPDGRRSRRRFHSAGQTRRRSRDFLAQANSKGGRRASRGFSPGRADALASTVGGRARSPSLRSDGVRLITRAGPLKRSRCFSDRSNSIRAQRGRTMTSA